MCSNLSVGIMQAKIIDILKEQDKFSISVVSLVCHIINRMEEKLKERTYQVDKRKWDELNSPRIEGYGQSLYEIGVEELIEAIQELLIFDKSVREFSEFVSQNIWIEYKK